ncbi:MAG: TonB-dependent receptor [Pseudomonadota bacterium]
MIGRTRWAWSMIGVVALLSFWNVTLALASEMNGQTSKQDDVIVTATKYETSTSNVPASVTIIHAEQLLNQNFPNQDIGDALRSITGISVRRAYAPFPSYVNIRGAGSDSTVYLVNGIPTDWQLSQAIPVEIIDRVEIIRGPASALYGANAGGGVINIIMKEGKSDPGTTVKTGFGSFDRFRSSLTSDGKIDNFQYALAGYYEQSDGANIVENNVNASVHMIDDCDYDKHGMAVSGTYRSANQAKVRLFYNYFNDDYTRGRPNVGGDWDYHMTGIIYDQEINPAVDIQAYAAWRVDDYLHLYDKGGTKYDLKMKRYMDYNETPIELKATIAMGMGHTLTTGIFYNNQTTEQDYRDSTGTTPSNTYENQFKVRTLAGYAQDVWNISDRLIMSAGLRYDHWENYDNHFDNFTTPNPDDRTDDSFSPKAGLRYNITDATSVWANYGMGFKPPTSEQLYDDRTSGGNPRQPNPDLKSEETQSWEIGADHWFGGFARASLVGFYSYTDDKIISWFDASNIWQNKNIGRSESYGSELSIEIYPTENVTLTANYTYNVATIDKNPQNPSLEGNDLPFSPRHKANIGVTYTQPESFTVSAGFRYLSDQYSDDANTVRNSGGELMMKESFAVDLKGTKHIRVNWGAVKRIDLSLSVDNLFNEDYRSFYMYEDPGTVFYGEIGITF